MARQEYRTPRGMRDFAPAEKRRRDWVVGRMRTIFERYGYEPIETPSVELYEVLKGKMGEEGDQLLFKILRRGTELEDLRLGKVSSVAVKRYEDVVDSALRFDLTVPFARFLSAHQDLPRPFKRYQIERVWRAERQQRGRYRELYQCDVDVAGTDSMLADAEIVALTVETLLDLGFSNFQTRIGHRKLLGAMVESIGGQEYFKDVCISVDKLDKIGPEGVKEEMRGRGIPPEVTQNVLERASLKGKWQEILDHLEKSLTGTQHGERGLAEMRELFEALAALGVPEKHYRLDLCLVRGLDYYTGPVYESIVTEPAIGSITGGGRYDELIGRFTGQPIPATGTSLGLERIIEVMKEFSMFPDLGAGCELLVAAFDASVTGECLALASELRNAGLRCEAPLKAPKGLKPQISYAANKGIPLIAILGPDEVAAGEVTLRSGPKDQRRVARKEAAEEARRFLEELRQKQS